MNKNFLIKFIPVLIIIFVIVFGTISLIGGGSSSGKVVELLPGRDIYGKQIDYQETNYYLIDVWATWCPPCVATIPELQSFYQANKDKGVVVLGLSVDKSPQKVFDFLDRTYTSYPVAMMNNDLKKALPNVRGIPTLFLYNKEGELLWDHIGSTTRSNLEAELSGYLLDPALAQYQ